MCYYAAVETILSLFSLHFYIGGAILQLASWKFWVLKCEIGYEKEKKNNKEKNKNTWNHVLKLLYISSYIFKLVDWMDAS